ncbi:MAG: 4Fe-4S ferredoxin [Desulfocapsaceae bacterium]|nr:4Fe-4S ferredoxin [Desulfocapsaceae bacterium]
MKSIRKIIKIDEELCNGCGQCIPDCAEGSLAIIDGKARLVADKLCDGLGACLKTCPMGALTIVEREADEFDEEAVEEYLASKSGQQKPSAPAGLACGCPSSHLQTFAPQSPCQAANTPARQSPGTQSALSHWPIQIRLVPPHAPFLQNADLLVVADCTAVAVSGFQQKYLEGKKVMMGCPKFDDAEGYIQRFAEIIATCNLKSLTILIMEVPCCSAMTVIIRKAMEKAGKTVPVEQITISTRGEELSRITW